MLKNQEKTKTIVTLVGEDKMFFDILKFLFKTLKGSIQFEFYKDGEEFLKECNIDDSYQNILLISNYCRYSRAKDIVDKVRKRTNENKVKAIVLSDFFSEADAKEIYDSKANYYFIKPINLKELRTLILNLINNQ